MMKQHVWSVTTCTASLRIAWKLEHHTLVTYPHGQPALPPRPHGLPRRALAAQPRFGKHHSHHLTLLKSLFRPSLPRLCHTVRGTAQPCRGGVQETWGREGCCAVCHRVQETDFSAPQENNFNYFP